MSPEPEAVVAALGPRPGVVWLDGGQAGARADGWSIVAWDPVEVATDADAWPADGRALGRAPSGTPARRGEQGAEAAPFWSGVLGYVGFEAGAAVDAVPAGRPTPEPPVWLGRFEGALCYRHRDRTWHATGTPEVRATGAALLERVVNEARALPSPPPPPVGARAHSVPRESHEAGVRQILAWIRAGDCYQVNLTRPVFVAGVGDAWAAYRRLRQAHAAYGAFLQLTPDCAVLSNSPELLLRIEGTRVLSCPIKGTRPRGTSELDDRALAEALAASPKDHAELTMIVDLVRNDLSRVCEVGSVRAGPRRLTTHPTLHHAVQGVEGRLMPGRDAWDALAASFPPGSVTGAPKVRACQRIRELEPHPRGVYCGAIGGVCDTGRAVFNVAIRTGVVAGHDGRYHVGGGIVADSVPADEWEETEVKARALAAALHGLTRR